MSKLRISTRRTSTGSYEGVLRDGDAVVFACGHRHHNRDLTSGANGQSALDCMTELFGIARSARTVDDFRRRILRVPAAYARRPGATTDEVQRLSREADLSVKQFDENIAKLSQLIGQKPPTAATAESPLGKLGG